MSMDYSQELASQALKQLNCPDGKPVFEHASLFLRLMYRRDVNNYLDYIKNREMGKLFELFSACNPESLKSLSLSQGADAPFGGEWFMNVTFGQNVKLSKGTNILAHGGITIGDSAIIGEQTQLVTVSHPLHPDQRYLILIGPLAIEAGAIVGAGAIALNAGAADAVKIGKNAIVLPGAIVSKSIPDYSVVGGVNKILLQGQKYFTDNISATVLSDRLNDAGLNLLKEEAKKQNIYIPADDVSIMPAKAALLDACVIDHDATKNLATLSTFFPGNSEEVLRLGLFFPPIYKVGRGTIKLGRNVLINTSSVLKVDGDVELGDKSFMAPEVEINVPQGAKLLIDKKVWLGAKVKVSVPQGETITLGQGSVFAAGAEVTTSVPPMSVVVGKGQITKTLTNEDKYDVSADMNDFDKYENQRLRLSEYIAKLSPEEVKQQVAIHAALPMVPNRFKGLGLGYMKNGS